MADPFFLVGFFCLFVYLFVCVCSDEFGEMYTCNLLVVGLPNGKCKKTGTNWWKYVKQLTKKNDRLNNISICRKSRNIGKSTI